MDIDKMLADLRLEREQIEEAILTLERLARGRGRRRGRPPSWLKDATAAAAAEISGTDIGAERTEAKRQATRRQSDWLTRLKFRPAFSELRVSRFRIGSWTSLCPAPFSVLS